MPNREFTDLQRVLGASGAWLLALAMFTGIPVAFAMTGDLPADGATMLTAHLNALVGSAWIFALAWSVPMLRYGETGSRRLATTVITAAYANWFITIVKAFLSVKGVKWAGDLANDSIYVSLDVFVVVPSLIAAPAWALGFRRAATAPAVSTENA